MTMCSVLVINYICGQSVEKISLSRIDTSRSTAAGTSNLISEILSSLLTFSMALIDNWASVAGDSSVIANQKRRN